MDKAKIKKISNIVLNVLLYIFLAICIFSVFITVFSKRDPDGAAEVFGYQMRIVTSDSMAESEFTNVSAYKIKDIPIRSMVFVKVMPDDPAKADAFYRSLKIGDVLTFKYVYTTQVTITHRITDIEEVEGGFKITLAGDNKNSEDGQLTQVIDTSVPNNTNYVIGKVTGQSKALGAVMSFLMKPIAIVLVVILPCFIIILLEVLKILRLLGADKKKREQEEKESKENELEELRRKLAALEEEKARSVSAESATDLNNNEENNEENKEDKTE